MSVISWIISNWELIGGIVAALLGLATLLTRLTATPADDEWVRRIAGWLSVLTHNDVAAPSAKLPLTRQPSADDPLIVRRAIYDEDDDSDGPTRL